MARPRAYVKVDDRDRGYRRTVATFGQLDQAEIELGVFGDKAARSHPDSDLTVGQLAAIHELGLAGQEPRPAVGQWTDQNEQAVFDDIMSAAQVALRGVPLPQTLEAVSKKWVAGVQGFVLSGQVRPLNSPETVSRKGDDRPLVGFTQTLVDAIDAKVKLKGMQRYAKKWLRAGIVAAGEDILDAAVGVGNSVSKRIRGRK